MRVRAAWWVGLVALIGLASGCQESSADLVAVANAFQAPSSWTSVDQSVESEPVCLRRDCKTAVAQWTSSEPPAADELRTLMADAGWLNVEVARCMPRVNVTGPVPFCRATATSDGTNVELTVSGPTPGGEPFAITLRVND